MAKCPCLYAARRPEDIQSRYRWTGWYGSTVPVEGLVVVVDQEEENKEILDEKCRKLTRIPKAKVVVSTTTPMKV